MNPRIGLYLIAPASSPAGDAVAAVDAALASLATPGDVRITVVLVGALAAPTGADAQVAAGVRVVHDDWWTAGSSPSARTWNHCVADAVAGGPGSVGEGWCVCASASTAWRTGWDARLLTDARHDVVADLHAGAPFAIAARAWPTVGPFDETLEPADAQDLAWFAQVRRALGERAAIGALAPFAAPRSSGARRGDPVTLAARAADVAAPTVGGMLQMVNDLAVHAYARGDRFGAARLLLEVLEADPGHADATHNLGAILGALALDGQEAPCP